ncbi:MAG: hypothetical protein GF309_09735 [Candidatus Lokiarchaeota archaeon]|nr:hypothetical protein [Candidatus Lokiarchaeota archaeon]
MPKLYFLPAHSILNMIHSQEISAQEVMTNLLHRIEEINPRINALVQYNAEDLLLQAQEADERISNGKKIGPLCGLPITIKDNIEVKGMTTTAGIKGREEYVPAFDATVVQRLKKAGAIIVGKTNCPAYCSGYETQNKIYGRTNNPYDLERTVGSSSGGEAALIAAGGSYIGIGSDTGGSIRWPSSYCGISSLVPTFGRVPRTGTIPPYLGFLDTTQIGPMARSAKDLMLVLPIIMGPDNWDSRCVPMKDQKVDEVDFEKSRIAYYADNGFVEADPEVRRVVSQAANLLGEKDIDLIHRYPDCTREFRELSSGLNRFAANIDKETEPKIDDWENPVELYPTKIFDSADKWLRKSQKARGEQAMLGLEFFFWSIKWDTYRTKILQFMDKHDAIICPVSAKPAFNHGDPNTHAFNGLELLSYTHPYSLVGLPAVTIRGGISSDGLPIGLQIITGHAEERLAVRIGRHLEKETGGWKEPKI